MSLQDNLPDLLVENIGKEPIDFTVMATRKQPVRKAIALVIFGAGWLAFTSIFVIAFFGPLLSGGEVHFTSNDVPVVATRENLRPLLVPAIMLGIFVMVGAGMLGFGLYNMISGGGFYAGTPNRLIHYHNGVLRSVDWEQFSGDITVNGNETKGNLVLGLRTGQMVSQKNGPARYVPDEIYLCGIPDVYEIEKTCRQRIKENDPTPARDLSLQ